MFDEHMFSFSVRNIEISYKVKNRIARWFSIYFPEYKDVYGKVDSVSGMMVLKQAPLPVDIVKLGVEGVNRIWREAKLRAVGYKRAKTLVKLAEHSVGSHEAPNAARVEITNLICDYEMYIERMDLLMETIEQRLTEIPYIDKLLEIKGIGMITVCGFIAETGRLCNCKQQFRKT